MEILQMSMAAAVLILVIVIVRSLTLHKLPKITFLILWGVALCRLLIPFAWPSRLSFYTAVNTVKSKLPAVGVDTSPPLDKPFLGMEITQVGTIQGPLTEKAMSLPPASVVWFIGCFGCALFFLITHLRCRRGYNMSLPVDNKWVQAWLQEHPTKRKVHIRQSDQIAAPLTYGIIRPVILLPKRTDWSDETELTYILTHEMVHIRRFDTLSKLLLVCALCVHWFNPLVWVMYMLANRDIEISCDEAVVKSFGGKMKSAYALTLIRLEEKKSSLTPLVNNFSKNAIEERIVSIMKIKKTSIAGGMLALALIVGVTTMFATNSAAQAQAGKGTVFETNYVTHYDTPEAVTTKDFSMYEEFGLLYDQTSDLLTYHGELVRYFEDYYPIEDNMYAGRDYFNKDGTVDVHGVRDLSQLTRQPDGSTDPSGKLLGVQPFSQVEFDARDIDELIHPSQKATSVHFDADSSKTTFGKTKDSREDNRSSSQVSTFEFGSTDTTIDRYRVTTINQMDSDQIQKLYSPYEKYGLTYDKETERLYYHGKLVRYFEDILKTGPSTYSRFHTSTNQDGDLDVRAIFNADGELIGLEPFSQAEFDERTSTLNR